MGEVYLPHIPLHNGNFESVLTKVVDRQAFNLESKIVILPHLLHIGIRSNMWKLTFSGIRPSWRKVWSVVELLRMLLFFGTEGLFWEALECWNSCFFFDCLASTEQLGEDAISYSWKDQTTVDDSQRYCDELIDVFLNAYWRPMYLVHTQNENCWQCATLCEYLEWNTSRSVAKALRWANRCTCKELGRCEAWPRTHACKTNALRWPE